MRIGIIVSIYLPSTIAGGVTSVAAEHAMELANRGHNVTVLTTNIMALRPIEYIEHKEEIKNSYKILRFNASAIVPHFSFVSSFPLLNWLKKHADEFDVFHIHYAREFFSISAVELLLRLGKKVFLQSHGMLDRREGLKKLLDIVVVRSQLKRACAVFALQSHEYKIQKEISPEAHVLILLNGIRYEGFPTWKKNNKKIKTILFLSRLHPRKRVFDFIDSARILLSKQDDLNFLIIGPDGGDMELARQKIISEEILKSHIKLLGKVDREVALQALSEADIYVLPSIDEPFPMALLEALAIGVPCVVTNRLQIIDLLSEYNAVEVVAPDPTALAIGITKLLSDNELCLIRSQNGRNLITNKLSIDKVINQLEEYYSL